MKKNTFRKLITNLHLWLGIGSGIILFIICLTGTILAFETELVLIFGKGDNFSKKTAKTIPFETLINTLENDGSKVKEFIFYGEENRNYQFTLLNSKEVKEISRKSVRGKSITLNPYTGKEITPIANSLKSFFHVIEKLHRFLLLDKKIGRPIVGISTIIFIFTCISGLVLWFPKKLEKFKKWKSWKQGFTIKIKGNWKRINYDTHNTLGFYALLPLLMMGLTGLLWSFTWYYDGLEKVLGDKLGKSRFDKTITILSNNKETSNINISLLLQKTDSILNYPNYATKVTLPLSYEQSIMIRKMNGSFLSYNAADKLQFNPHNNKLVSKTLFKNEKIGSKVAGLIRGIHVGDFAGITTKILYFICCLIATSLPITGTLIWINKKKRKLQELL